MCLECPAMTGGQVLLLKDIVNIVKIHIFTNRAAGRVVWQRKRSRLYGVNELIGGISQPNSSRLISRAMS